MNTKKLPHAPADQPESLDLPLKYAGKNFTARFSIRAFSRLKDHWSLHTDPIGADNRRTGDDKLGERMGLVEMEDIPVMLWAALRSHHPDLTIEDVEEMVDEFGVNPLQPFLAKLMKGAMPPADAKKKP